VTAMWRQCAARDCGRLHFINLQEITRKSQHQQKLACKSFAARAATPPPTRRPAATRKSKTRTALTADARVRAQRIGVRALSKRDSNSVGDQEYGSTALDP
jgi:hypothetical protein